MKKVIRLTEGDLNYLVKRIINEYKFDMDSIEQIDGDRPDFDEHLTDVISKYKIAKSKYDEFVKNGVPMKSFDVEILLSIAQDYCKHSTIQGNPHEWCYQVDRIEKIVDDIHLQNHSTPNRINRM
jgi:hypothetical protein